MEFFEKKIKTILQEDSKIPENLTWDHVKHGINDKLSKDEKIIFGTGRSWFKTVFLTGFVTLSLIILFLMKCPDQDFAGEDMAKENQEFIAKSFQDGDTKQDLNQPEVNENVLKGEGIVDRSTAGVRKSGQLEQRKILSENNNGSSLQGSGTVLMSAGKNKSENFEKPQVSNADQKEQIKETVFENSPQRISFTIGLVRLRPCRVISAQNETLNMKATPLERKDIIAPARGKWAIGLGLAANVMKSNFRGTSPIVTLRGPATDPIIGQAINLSIMHQFPNGRFFNSAVGWSNLNEKFEIEFDKNMTVLVKDALVGIDSNIITNRITYLRKDTLVNIVERRHIIHYNNYRTVDLSLSYGRRFDLGSLWKINYEAGINYSRSHYSNGRTAGLNYEIREFDDKNTLFTRNHFGLFTGLGILYKYNDVISIGSDIFILQYFDNWSIEKDVILQPTKLSFNMVVRYWL